MLARFWDPIPRFRIGDETIQFAPSFTWYELTWILLPFLLLVPFGAIGGFSGAASSLIAGRLFRGDRGILAKYCISALIGIGIMLATALLALFLQELVHLYKT
jgi:hypothetical protein